MANLYKPRLHTYAQKKNIPLPMYTVETQGPPHARLFKAEVTIDGNTYDGPAFCTTLKEAEHAAAKIALASLSPDAAPEGGCMYKSSLHELAQKKGLPLPVYTTNRTGPPHVPCFVSTVVVSGESYEGEAARTKKQSEINAAKVAYIALTGGGTRANSASGISNIAGTSSVGSSTSQPVMLHNNEPTASKMQTVINNGASYKIPSDPEKAKGYIDLKDLQEAIETNTMVLPPVSVNQPQPKFSPDVVNLAQRELKQKNHVNQASEGSGSNDMSIEQSFNEDVVMNSVSAISSPNGVGVPKPTIKLTNHATQAGEVSGSNGKRIEPFVNGATLHTLMDSSCAMPHSTKILIRPHEQGMTYEGPIHVSDEEWVAMKVNVHDGMKDEVM